MKRILIPSLLFLLASTLTLAARDYISYIDMADQAVEKQDWNHAEELLRIAMQIEPSNPQNVMLLQNIGMFQFYRGEDSLALHTLSEAHAIAPASTVILRNRAKVLRHSGRPADAIADYTQLIRMDSTDYNAYFERGYLLMTSGDTLRAKADFDAMERLRPDDPNTLLMLAVVNSNRGDYPGAISYYNRLIPLAEKAEYYCGRAMCHLALKQLPEASADIARGLELNADDPELYYCRAYLHLLEYREEEARADAAIARRLGMPQERLDELFSR